MNITLLAVGWYETAATPGAPFSPDTDSGSHKMVSLPVAISTFSMDLQFAKLVLNTIPRVS